jgi:hypothetical protein
VVSGMTANVNVGIKRPSYDPSTVCTDHMMLYIDESLGGPLL